MARILKRREVRCIIIYKIVKENISLMKGKWKLLKRTKMELLEKKIQ